MPRTLKPRPELRALNLDLKDPIERKEYSKMYLRIYRKERPEYFRSVSKKDYQKHRKKRLDASNKWRKKNHPHVIKRKREHYAENRERLGREKRERYWKNPEKVIAQVKKYRTENRDKILLKKKKEFRDYRFNVLTYYSKGIPKCNNCGINEIPFLHIDHIYGRKAMGHSRNQSTVGFYRELHKKHPEGYQVLCANCNIMKEIRSHKNHSKNPLAIKSRYYKKRSKKQVMEYYSNSELKCSCCSFAEIDGAFMIKYANSPAASFNHHNFGGGLLEHVLNMIKISMQITELYPKLDKDLLVAGCILHDIGKVNELKMGTAIEYTNEGHLLGHIAIGMQIVSNAMNKVDDFPDILKQKILHMVLSHHGTKDKGSPVEPLIPEAVILHQVDYCDSRIQKIMQEIGNAGENDEWVLMAVFLLQQICHLPNHL